MGTARLRKRKICVVTGARADYGLLVDLLSEIKQDPRLQLQLVVTGMHLSPKYGRTIKDIERDGFRIHKKVPILNQNNQELGITQSVGKGCQLFALALRSLDPDIVVVLGDRYEILAAAIAAYIAKIPLAHIHGGELTQGALDEGFRHAITKMAHIHFATTEQYRRRIIQMGEDPKSVFNYGAPGLDGLRRITYMSRQQLERKLGFDLKTTTAIVTFHPETLAKEPAQKQVQALLAAIKKERIKAIFTGANADPHADKITAQIKSFCRENPKRYKFIDHLGREIYFNCLKNLDLMVGNSSSGLIEAPSFKLPVVNIGDRQKSRLRAKNIIDVRAHSSEISKGIRKALSIRFRSRLSGMTNPYCRLKEGDASRKIKEKLKRLNLHNGIIKKKFHDISVHRAVGSSKQSG